MTSELEYSYLNCDFALKVSEDLLTRAVRVKQAVKEKLGRIYSKNLVSEEVAQPSVPVAEASDQKNEAPQEEAKGLESLIDLSEGNVAQLDSKITALQNQSGISHVVRRAVLFTSALKNKISRVTSKWFENVEKEDRTQILPKVEYTNHLGGEVVPGTWDDKVEEKEEEVTPQFEIPSFSVEPQVELPKEEKTVDLVPEPQAIPMSGLEPVIPTMEPVVEPKVEMPVAEAVASAPEVEENVAPAVEMPQPESSQSIEDKIAAILNRKNEVAKVSEEPANEVADREMVSDSPQLANKTDVLARLHRFKNTLQERDAQIEKLSSKLSSANTALEEAKAKISSYETVLDDLTAECNSLTQANEQLTSKNSNIDAGYSTKIASLEDQLSELRQSRTDEAESSKSVIAELKAKHAQEIEELKAKHAQEIHDIEASKNKQINAIYATISEALGEPTYSDDESSKTM